MKTPLPTRRHLGEILGLLALTMSLLSACAGGADPADIGPIAEVRPDTLVSGEPVVPEIVVHPGSGIPAGGVVRLHHYTKPWRALARGLEDDGRSNRLVSAERSDGGGTLVRLIKRDRWGFAGRSHIDVEMTGRELAEGEELVIRLGTRQEPIAAGRKQQAFRPEIGLDLEGDGTFEDVASRPLRIRESRPASLGAVLPSFAAPGEPVELIVFFEDRFGNLCEEIEDELTLRTPAGEQRYAMRALDRTRDLDRNAVELAFPAPGVYTIDVTSKETGLTATSNPIVVGNDARRRRLFWGDLQVHTAVSDGEGEVIDVYRDAYARGHDFLAITDHGFGRAARGSLDERLAAIVNDARRFTVPGRFVGIPAGETHFLRRTHMNLYFKRLDAAHMGRLVSRIEAAKTRIESWRKASPEDFAAAGRRYWSAFDDDEFREFPLAFPHHTLWIGVLEYINAPRQRLIEIYSFHGSSEVTPFDDTPAALRGHLPSFEGRPGPRYSVRQALARGHQLGFVGGSDDHFGQAGSHSLTGVFADELSLEAILDGLSARDCYAASGHRTIVEFSAEGVPMGSRGVAGAESVLRGEVVADGRIDRLQIVSSEGVVHEQSAGGARRGSIRWTPGGAPDFYYLRAVLDDGHAAWSSPLWLD